MHITLTRDGRSRVVPHPDGPNHTLPVPNETCGSCRSSLEVSGRSTRKTSDGRGYETDAHCSKCGEYVGHMRIEPEMMFGGGCVDCARCGMRHYGVTSIPACVACMHPMTPARQESGR